MGLYSHSDQQRAAQTLLCRQPGAPAGVAGRLADFFHARYNQKSSSFSTAGMNRWSQGLTTEIELAESGGRLTLTDTVFWQPYIDQMAEQRYGNVYCDEYVATLGKYVNETQRMNDIIDSATLTTTFQDRTSLDSQLKHVARLMKEHVARGAERDFFFVQYGGWDTHNCVEPCMGDKFSVVDSALELFVTETVTQGVFDETVLFTASDFGRTLSGNGKGTDHGWAGNHMILGGKVNGGNVFNTYTESFAAGNEYDAGRGRVIPKHPWESMMVPIAEWAGVTDSADKHAIFPNLAKFDSSLIISANALFNLA